jgi:hypothetical protein
MTAFIEYLKIHSPPPNSREVYKCFNKAISVTWHTKVSLPPRVLCRFGSNAAGDIRVYMTSLVATPMSPGRNIHLIISHDSQTTTSFPMNFTVV